MIHIQMVQKVHTLIHFGCMNEQMTSGLWVGHGGECGKMEHGPCPLGAGSPQTKRSAGWGGVCGATGAPSSRARVSWLCVVGVGEVEDGTFENVLRVWDLGTDAVNPYRGICLWPCGGHLQVE